MKEALSMLEQRDIFVDTMRIRSFPFGKEVENFISIHEYVFLIEQNRDAQLKKTLLVNDLNIDPDRILSILYFGGMSISADFIVNSVHDYYDELNIAVLREVAS